MGMAMTGVAGLILGHVSPFRAGGGSRKTKKEMERLYSMISSKNAEVQKLKTMIYEYEYRNQELKQALIESEQESLKRDYEEFKQPDANGDDVISRAEVGLYKFWWWTMGCATNSFSPLLIRNETHPRAVFSSPFSFRLTSAIT